LPTIEFSLLPAARKRFLHSSIFPCQLYFLNLLLLLVYINLIEFFIPIVVMLKPQVFRQALRAASRHDSSYTPNSRHIILKPQRSARWLSSSAKRAEAGSKDDPYRTSSTAAKRTEKHAHEGSFSRTDNQVSFEYPDEQDFPRSQIVQGRGGPHLKRTLPSFSLEGKVAVVTGGARGLGLVMGQALVTSGADLAIVDLNSELQRECELSRSIC
jgi:D-arabinitol 2-dehydrogenase